MAGELADPFVDFEEHALEREPAHAHAGLLEHGAIAALGLFQLAACLHLGSHDLARQHDARDAVVLVIPGAMAPAHIVDAAIGM